jgi:hypothetical protein
MTPEKKAEIIAHLTAHVQEITALSKVAYPRKRLFAKKNRSPLRRINKHRAKMGMAMNVYFGWINLHRILTAPIPKFPKGSNRDSGIAIIGENGQEAFLRSKERIIPLPR